MYKLLLLAIITLLISCQEIIDAPLPNLAWDEYDAAGNQPLTAEERKGLEGIFKVGEAADDFGKEAAMKWSYIANGKDTAYYLSFFCAEDVRYFICQAKKNDSTILLNGYWRNVENTKTGKAHFRVSLTAFNNQDFAAGEQRMSLGIEGNYGMGDDIPGKKINFRYTRPLQTEKPYLIIAHRGGGRNNDLLPASENSIEIIPLAAQYGANGVELDVKLTKDSIPILYHDERINDRLTNKGIIRGLVADYSYAEIQKDIELKRGGKIPTLTQALETVLYKTPLEFVWLDCKYGGSLSKVRELQKEFTQKAAAIGKKLEIVIGIPDEKALTSFTRLPGYQNIPSLSELDTAETLRINANIWAPSWTKGHQDEIVLPLQAKGKRAVVWTIDVPDKIKEFMYEAKFNGIVTNRPTMAAYYYYAMVDGR